MTDRLQWKAKWMKFYEKRKHRYQNRKTPDSSEALKKTHNF